MIYNNIIVDVYNLVYRWSFNENEKIISNGTKKIHTEGIIAYIKGLTSYLKKFADNNTKVYLCFDNATTLYDRHEQYDLYKSNRKENQPPEWFYRELDYCELISRYFRDNTFLFRVKYLEADDFVENILKYYVKENETTLLISEDMDWSRYISDKVNQYTKHDILTVEKFIDVYGFEPTINNVTWYKTIYGDKSDFVFGALKNLPKTYFLDIIEKYNNVESFIKDALNNKISYFDIGWKLKVEKESETLKTNWSLISAVQMSIDDIAKYKYNCIYKEQKLRMIYESLEILGIDERIKGFQNKFSIFDMLDGEMLERKK